MSCASSTTTISNGGFPTAANVRRQSTEQTGGSYQSFLIHGRLNALEYIPKLAAATLRQPRSSAKPLDVAVRFPSIQLPRIYDKFPFGHQELVREIHILDFSSLILEKLAYGMGRGNLRPANPSLIQASANCFYGVYFQSFGYRRFNSLLAHAISREESSQAYPRM